MPSYIGFSTIGANQPKTTNVNPGVDGGFGGISRPVMVGKRFRLVDEQLVVRDFINALNIRKGEKVGQPGYGTNIWTFVFEPNTSDTQFKLEDEIRRVAKSDPRIVLNTVKSYVQDNGILLEVEVAISPFNNAEVLSIFFNSSTNKASLR
jgi:phage baseplate assembly protein W